MRGGGERRLRIAAPEIVQRVWGKAKELGYESAFIPEAKTPITDDHIPLIKAGLRVIDVGGLANAGPLEGITAVLATINRRYKLKNSGIKITGL